MLLITVHCSYYNVNFTNAKSPLFHVQFISHSPKAASRIFVSTAMYFAFWEVYDKMAIPELNNVKKYFKFISS